MQAGESLEDGSGDEDDLPLEGDILERDTLCVNIILKGTGWEVET